MSLPRLTIQISEVERDALVLLANQERRLPAEMAALLVRQGLELRNMLPGPSGSSGAAPSESDTTGGAISAEMSTTAILAVPS